MGKGEEMVFLLPFHWPPSLITFHWPPSLEPSISHQALDLPSPPFSFSLKGDLDDLDVSSLGTQF
jgi:hypothetical protein